MRAGATTARAVVLFLAVALLGIVCGAARAQTVRIGIVVDGPTDREVLPAEVIRKAAADVAGAGPALVFAEDGIFTGDWTLAGVNAAIERALGDEEVDVVLLLGVLASHQGARVEAPSRPLIAPIVIDPVLQGFPLAEGKSGRQNFSYAADFHGIANDLATYRQVTDFRHLAILVDRALLEALPELSQKAADLQSSLDARLTIVPTGRDVAAVLAALPPDADAVYVTGLMQFGEAELADLAQGLAERRLPSFSLTGRTEVDRGLLMTTGGAERDIERLARRIVLMVQRIALGEDPANFEVSFPTAQRLVINMRVANEIGFSPSWEYLADAELLHTEPAAEVEQLSLLEAMREALDANPSLAASGARLSSAGEDVRIAQAALLPSVDVFAERTRIDADRASPLTVAEDSVSAGMTAQQVIYSERARASLSISRSLHEASSEGHRQDMLDLLQATATAYLDVLLAKSVESVRRDNTENTRRNLETSRVREAVGLAERSDYLRWVAELARDKQSFLAAEANRRQAETDLMRLLHRPAERPFMTVEAGVDDPLNHIGSPRTRGYIGTPEKWTVFTEYAVQAALQAAPEVAQGEALIAGNRRAVTAARRAFYLPDLALVSSSSTFLSEHGAGSLALPGAPDDEAWSVSLQASWPLFTGGRRRAELAQARYELQAAEADRQAAADFVEARVRSALHRTAASWPSIELSREAAAAADENHAKVGDAYARGVVSVTELIDAQETALEASLAAADARYGFLVDFVDVLRAMGDFDLLLDPGSREAWHQRVDEWFRHREIPTSTTGQTGR